MNKEQLRLKLKRRLSEMSSDQRIEKSRRACQKLISTPEFVNSSVIMMFLSIETELDTADAVLHSWQTGKTVVVPKVNWETCRMLPVRITSLESGFSTDIGGLRNPKSGVPIPFGAIDLVVVPGLGFDRTGSRIGRGGGYYDRFLSHDDLDAVRCGFAFSDQVVDEVPMTEHDKTVDQLVTDEEIIYFDKR